MQTNDVYSTRCTIQEILGNEEGKAVLTKYLGDFSENPSIQMALGMKIDTLATMAEDMFNEKMLYTLNKELIKIKKVQ
jgi:beta-galactosidase